MIKTSFSVQEQKLHLLPPAWSPQSFSSPTTPETPESPGIPLIANNRRDKPSDLRSLVDNGDGTEDQGFSALSKLDAVSSTSIWYRLLYNEERES